MGNTENICGLIGWIRTEHEMPDADMVVLVFNPDQDDPVWLGYYDGGDWVLVDGSLAEGVTHWAQCQRDRNEPPLPLHRSLCLGVHVCHCEGVRPRFMTRAWSFIVLKRRGGNLEMLPHTIKFYFT